MPTVLVNCYDPEGAYKSIVPDDRVGGYLAAKHLIAQGHRNVAYLSLPEELLATHLRKEGFARAFASQGYGIPLMISGTNVRHQPGQMEHESLGLSEALDQVLSQTPRPTAIFCGNDKMAMTLYGLLSERGLSVPEHISVLGFDDFAMITELMRPQLSSVSLRYYDMGRLSVTALIEQIDAKTQNRDYTPSRALVPGRIMKRASVAAPTAQIPAQLDTLPLDEDPKANEDPDRELGQRTA